MGVRWRVGICTGVDELVLKVQVSAVCSANAAGETVGETGCAPAIFGWGETTAGQPVAAGGVWREGVGALVEEVTVVATDPADVDAVPVLTDSPLRLDQTSEPTARSVVYPRAGPRRRRASGSSRRTPGCQ